MYNAIFGLFKNKTIVTSLVEVLQPDTKSKQTTALGQSSITSDPFETFCMRPCAEMTALKCNFDRYDKQIIKYYTILLTLPLQCIRGFSRQTIKVTDNFIVTKLFS